MILVNFKSYKEASGDEAVRQASLCSEVSEETGVETAVSPSLPDTMRVARESEAAVFAQHVDPVGYGSHTGSTSPSYLKEVGLSGTLLNHSERRLAREVVFETLETCVRIGFPVVLCTQSVGDTERLLESRHSPTYVAIEPPQLIGTGRSVSSHRPDLIRDVKRVVEREGVPLLCGAGISDGQDVKSAVEMGAEGVLVASGVVKAEDPRGVLLDMASNL